MKYVDKFLNGITMYKLVSFGLTALAVIAVILGFVGVLPYGGISLICSLLILSIVCYGTNYVFAKAFNVQTNSESYIITAFILFFITFPPESLRGALLLAIVAFIAMASKYILAINKKHVFNPAAVSVFLVGIFGVSVVAWWVGSSVMFTPVAILGLLILRKLRRFQMFGSFLITAFVSVFLIGFSASGNLIDILSQVFLSGPMIFFGSIMLTEPLTTPPTKRLQILYGAIVGILYGLQFNFGILYSTPELALIIGNLFSYIVSPRARLVLTLVSKNKLSADIYEFVWKSNEKLSFKAGQYLEWTLGHSGADMRGNRRFFTIAASPTEENLKLGVKFYDNSSSFKKKLSSLVPGNTIIASQLAGEFTLPKDSSRKLAFIAGGIGVTPFRSIAKDLSDRGDVRDAILLFSNKTANDIVYKDIFDAAREKAGLKTIHVIGDLAPTQVRPEYRTGMITEEMIRQEIPDFNERIFYISGPHGMVSAFEDILKKLGVKRSDIKVDFFPGFV